ncbi:hypothetical protein BDN67DRAFT_322356 [Paxillus ammoniavirescens]|nr:hypothetical protein BDN67DRAFT_322356 [Paxillus ammoniavirescens]
MGLAPPFHETSTGHGTILGLSDNCVWGNLRFGRVFFAAESADLTAKPLMTISGHGDDICKITYHLPAGERVVSCVYDKTVRICNVRNGEQTRRSMGMPLISLSLRERGEKILSSGGDAKLTSLLKNEGVTQAVSGARSLLPRWMINWWSRDRSLAFALLTRRFSRRFADLDLRNK